MFALIAGRTKLYCALEMCAAGVFSRIPARLDFAGMEEIEDTSSQEDQHVHVNLPRATKKQQAKSKKDSPGPSSTLTRFLGPAGPPSLAAWEDVNRQCPVCQQTGFSSRSLALHVNECLDVGRNPPDAAAAAASGEGDSAGEEEEEEGANGEGNTGIRHTPKTASGSSQRVGKVKVRSSIAAKASGAGSSRDGAKRKMGASGTGSNVGHEQQRRPDKAAGKKAKTQQDRQAGVAEKSGACVCSSAAAAIPYSSIQQDGQWVWVVLKYDAPFVTLVRCVAIR